MEIIDSVRGTFLQKGRVWAQYYIGTLETTCIEFNFHKLVIWLIENFQNSSGGTIFSLNFKVGIV